jgi:DNA invertase Pin-like site-specific DNA recombinase
MDTSIPQGAGAPVGVAALVRTSTLDLQDPVASYRRQVRAVTSWLPAGWYLAAVYADVESGATNLDARSRTGSWQVLADAGLRRDGGMADLLAEAMAPDPAFQVVVVEEIERASRDFYDSVTLERRLAEQGIPLLATDEPADVTGLSPTMILVRRIKQGVAEWYRISLKGKIRQGLEEHSLAGWNVGSVPFGYRAERVPHAVPAKAALGRTRTRLVIDPEAGPWVTQMFEWRVLEKLSAPAIALRLDAAGVPSPAVGGWSRHTVSGILANPKYTGHMVYGRRRNAGKSERPGERKVRAVPAAEWTWSPEPAHPALVSREMWDAAQKAGKEHSGVRDAEVPTRQPGRRYALRARVHCFQCGRRMNGITRHGYHAPGSYEYVYYLCPWLKTNPRDVARCPGHVRASLREDHLTAAISGFLDSYVLGHDRAAMLEDRLPKNAADQAAARDAKAAELTRRIARNDAAAKGLVTELAQLGDSATPASAAYRARIREHFEELHAATEALNAELAGLQEQAAAAAPADLIDQIPYAPGLLAKVPDEIRATLYAALDLHCVYRADQRQVTIRATITDSTPGIIAALLADPRAGGDPAQAGTAACAEPQHAPIGGSVSHSSGSKSGWEGSRGGSWLVVAGDGEGGERLGGGREFDDVHVDVRRQGSGPEDRLGDVVGGHRPHAGVDGVRLRLVAAEPDYRELGVRHPRLDAGDPDPGAVHVGAEVEAELVDERLAAAVDVAARVRVGAGHRA